MPRRGAAPPTAPRLPDGFRVARDLPLGRHPLLDAFPGLDRLETAARHVPDARRREALHRETLIELIPEDVWMYVAPEAVPPDARGRWKPVLADGHDCIVIGEEHFRKSPELILFLDIFHELCHILQRRGGADLWPPGKSYVQRWTEVEAYRFVIDEARRLGVSDEFLREYLRVEWISADEHRTPLAAVGLAAQNP